MSRPRLLDLFCGAGGAGYGYHLAGFDVVGVDIAPQHRYPFAFVCADALAFAEKRGHTFDAIHASPPCQAYTWGAKRWDRERADLVAPTRELLDYLGKSYVIENVPGAPLRVDLVLTGPMFGLSVIRRRHFEMNWFCMAPPYVPPVGSVRGGEFVMVAGHGGDGRRALHLWKAAMGIDWMTGPELAQAVPPAFTRFIGEQLKGATP